ncbi:hypothetical protein Bache_1252 [Bacteroides helcogenes P 36-108]|uniref:Uncharacterized protein n=2 Tax=Bacteroides helcogenes TaxID=290053 RepID=E6STI8_BACT6|nr:hypothetical protein Bache_1252 [Bacteroides helcogenes P 36-108]
MQIKVSLPQAALASLLPDTPAHRPEHQGFYCMRYTSHTLRDVHLEQHEMYISNIENCYMKHYKALYGTSQRKPSGSVAARIDPPEDTASTENKS